MTILYRLRRHYALPFFATGYCYLRIDRIVDNRAEPMPWLSISCPAPSTNEAAYEATRAKCERIAQLLTDDEEPADPSTRVTVGLPRCPLCELEMLFVETGWRCVKCGASLG